MSEAKPYFIVWNGDRSEGFITNDEHDAKSARTGKPHTRRGYRSQSALGEAFHEFYGEHRKPRTQKVTL